MAGTRTISRRTIVAAGAAALAAPALIGTARAQAKRIVIRDIGIGTSFADAFGKGFKEATGIEVVAVTAQHEPTGMIKQMVDAGAYTWDMANVSRMAADQLVTDGKGYLEPLKVDDHAGWKALPGKFKTPYFAGNDVVATVLAYRKDRVKRAPKSWADFWNVKEFPGPRALRRFPFDTIEQALLADGVAGDKLYPCDFDRAFKSLDRIRKDISVWWTSGAQTSQLLKSGEVDFCPTWNGRAQGPINDGAPVAIMWEQALWQAEGWVILKGTPKADLCREFVKYALSPERQAIFSAATGYGPTLTEAIKHIEPAKATAMPTNPENDRGSILVDAKFWSENKDKAADLFNKWVVR